MAQRLRRNTESLPLKRMTIVIYFRATELNRRADSGPTCLEAVSDDDEVGTRAPGGFKLARRMARGFNRLVVLRHRLQCAKKCATLIGDLPTIAVAQHVAAGENIDRRNASGETPHPRVPFGAAGGENGNVSLE